jgi:hypothetical protein
MPRFRGWTQDWSLSQKALLRIYATAQFDWIGYLKLLASHKSGLSLSSSTDFSA